MGMSEEERGARLSEAIRKNAEMLKGGLSDGPVEKVVMKGAGEPQAWVPMPPTKFTAAFAFKVGDEVEIVDIKKRGIVEELRYGAEGARYLVSYWRGHARNTEVLHAGELTPR